MFSLKYPPRTFAGLRADARRVVLGTAYALRPKRVAVLPAVLSGWLMTKLGLERYDACLKTGAPVPRHPLGFAGICGDMTPDVLMRGFAKGLYPFSHVGRKKWWMNPERMAIAPHAIVRDKDAKRMVRNKRFKVTFDTCFEDVMRACAAPRDGKTPLTWITEDIIAAYTELHRAGHAHSFEAWADDGTLAGGGFGIASGPVFVIESQFTAKRNASKVAMVTLMRHLSAWGFLLADGKAFTPYLKSVGFRLIPHADYVAALNARAPTAPVDRWEVDETLDASEDWEAGVPAEQRAWLEDLGDKDRQVAVAN
ncbi:leucyl/phenylalanyl-tRNA--protein transferase [Pelagibacterium xiamenense]|uniref:leucyl/phenylalanyl-tRNA--protein transferase n=1 Tax=Pelagibacterium xiamenense TaxID=2901140 RepID=UPI001E5D0CD2|nr:leucyl/phenylalanyl-tRNA--protein transferase [Pelagibacterium xiamenense]MCD7060471.1 leucyl/phenylalanyl-tRNA--protein transferase [Pelagibacterium xiamenense]